LLLVVFTLMMCRWSFMLIRRLSTRLTPTVRAVRLVLVLLVA
jgi:hypothetical protein